MQEINETREEGFYWVRHDQDWQPVHLDKEQVDNKNGYWCEIGPKIEPPVKKDDGIDEHKDAIYKYVRPTLIPKESRKYEKGC